MKIIGRISKKQMAIMEDAGLDPKEAVRRTMVEAKMRYPNCIIQIVPSNFHDGMDVIAL